MRQPIDHSQRATAFSTAMATYLGWNSKSVNQILQIAHLRSSLEGPIKLRLLPSSVLCGRQGVGMGRCVLGSLKSIGPRLWRVWTKLRSIKIAMKCVLLAANS